MSLGPYDLTAEPFLMLYLILLAGALMLSLIIPVLMRPAGRDQPVTDPDHLAWLNGGITRLAESAVTRLMTARVIEQGIGDRFSIDRGATAASPVEAGIVRLAPSADWAGIEKATKGSEEAIRGHLTSRGLLIAPAQLARVRVWQTAPLVPVILFGIPKLFVGIERERPIGYLTVLLILTVIVAVVRYVKVDARTEAAIGALSAAKTNSQRLRIAPTRPEMGLAVALFGTSVLAGSYYQSFHNLRQSPGDGGSSSSDSDGGSGGCGGCGD